MKLKFGTASALFLAFACVAQAQTPAIATIWGATDLPHEKCLAQSRAVFEKLKYRRIESVGFDTFADYERFQVAIRCIPSKQIFYVYGGGPGNADKRLIEIMDIVKSEFLQ
jgi:hypothetical protein